MQTMTIANIQIQPTPKSRAKRRFLASAEFECYVYGESLI